MISGIHAATTHSKSSTSSKNQITFLSLAHHAQCFDKGSTMTPTSSDPYRLTPEGLRLPFATSPESPRTCKPLRSKKHFLLSPIPCEVLQFIYLL